MQISKLLKDEPVIVKTWNVTASAATLMKIYCQSRKKNAQ